MPPPPPPIPVLTGQVKCAIQDKNCHKYFKEALQLEEEVDSLVEFILKDLSLSINTHSTATESTTSHERPAVITFIREVTPVIQNGPMCGLTALSMACELVSNGTGSVEEDSDRHPETLLSYAQTHHLSKQGELFSVEYVQDIAEHHLQYNTKIHNIDTLPLTELLGELLCDDVAILVPYDADKNHSPCQANGHKAHWCLLVGFAIVLENSIAGNGVPGPVHWYKQSSRLPWHYNVNKQNKDSFLSSCSSWLTENDHNRLFVFARHGKSARMGLWSHKDLMDSCRNLLEVDPKRSCPEEYVIPEGGVAKGLKSKLVLISSNSKCVH